MFPRLEPWVRLRLSRVLDARVQAEALRYGHIRGVGIFTIVMGIVALDPRVPFVLPYAASCVAMAIALAMTSAHLHGITQRRAAPLVRRRALDVLSPLILTAPILSLLATVAVAMQPEFRLAAAGVLLSSLLMLSLAWRAALAPALLMGDDPQLEYAVDEHIRYRRANGLAILACAPGTVLYTLLIHYLPTNWYDILLEAVLWAAFSVGILVLEKLSARRLRLA
ncbi:MAG TPA: hypothetical protein VKB39_08915 [Candidatus Baltobacteraceae bacterium]|nr:hypothetical protein [Candidatus Baltobacteraceae bacterium]